MYSRRCGVDTADCINPANGCPCVCEKPHDPTPAEIRDLADSTEWPLERPVRPPGATNGGLGSPGEAGRQPHSKPRTWHRRPHQVMRGRIWVWQARSSWVIDLRGCCSDGLERYAGTQVEAMDAAHAHVREHHEPTPWDLDESPGDPDEELAAITCWCGRICCRHHRDDIEPSQIAWAEALDRSMNGSRDS